MMYRLKGLIYGVISSATFGLIPLFALPAIRNGIGVDSVMFYRFGISALVLGLWLVIRRYDLRISGRELFTLAGLGIFYAMTALLLTISYLYIPSGIATTIHFLYPVVVTTVMILFFKDKVSVPVIGATLMAILGVYLLSNNGTAGTVSLKGLLLVLTTVVTYALYIVGVNKSCVHRMDGLKLTFYVLLVGAMVFGLNLSVKGVPLDPIPDWETGVYLLLLALIPTLVSDFTLILSVQHVGSTTTAVLGCMEPLTAVCMGVWFLHESLGFWQLAGIVFDSFEIAESGSMDKANQFQSLNIALMVTLKRITQAEDEAFRKLTALYTEAFPVEERREIGQLGELLHTEPAMYFNAVECDGQLAGLFVYWDFGSFYYLEHLAVFAEMRNKKIGQQILDWVKEQLQGVRLLEVEPAETEMATRRIHYYERNGYRILDRNYLQPPYVKGGKDFPLWVMGNGSGQSAEVLNRQIQTIKDKVYYRL